LSRLGQVKVAIFLALSRGLIKAGDTVVFLAGLAATGTLDTLIVTQVGREYEIFSSSEGNVNLPKGIRAEVVEKTIDIATQLGAQGREGKPVGALFVIGDTERVASMTRQLVINPFQGYPRQKRNILDDNLTETIKEFSGIDGAFIISGDGIIESCGTYLKTASQEEFELPRGLGARHHSAAGITSVADCIAITVSESTGTVTVFRGGQIITEIERQRSIGVKAQQAKP
jgi:DNA integrity scanning protein DisA with diadenylate cyclase activity